MLDDAHALTDELTLTHARFEKSQARIIRDFGYGDTKAAVSLSQAALPPLADAVAAALDDPPRKDHKFDGAFRLLRQLSAETIALSTLQSTFHIIATGDDVRATTIEIGTALNNELWAAGLLEHDARLAGRIERKVRSRHGALKYRQQAARSAAKRAGYSKRAPWNRVEKAQVGAWALNIALEALPDILTLDDQLPERHVTITEGAHDIALSACDFVMRRNPVFMPSVEPPKPWNGWQSGGPTDPRMQRSVTVVRSVHRETAGVVRAAIASGQMQPTLDALNAIQATPWRINKRMLDIIRECHESGIAVKGLPRAKDYDLPEHETPWEDMEDIERTFWKMKATEVKRANHGLVGDRFSFSEDITIAESLAEAERFYTACNLDWRGRVYALPHFNFQREDRVRALFEFADGEPLGEEGLWWLKVHVANCGDFGKVSKQSFEERVAWVDRSTEWIKTIASDPIYYQAWTGADKPFLFLASCFELAAAIATDTVAPGTFVTRLPVSFDGSCSGLQHLCAMTRAPEGAFVNLTPSEQPQDVYRRVADACAIHVKEDAAEGNVSAQAALAYGVDRSLVKRNVMTYSYSSKKFGMSKQLVEDVMQPLKLEVLGGERDEHPFGDDAGLAASKYLAGRIYGAIEEIVELPAKAMAFLQKLARTLAHEGKPLTWTTPAGLPWVNRYHEYETRRVVLWLHDNGVRLPLKTTIAVGHHKEIDKNRAANGVAPNFVHANDAAHLKLTVNAAHKEGFRHFALVHDSFGCLASRAGRFHEIIREQFVEMYQTHDVLAEILAQAKRDLTEAGAERLPELPVYGNLNIKDVLDARYAFA